MLWIIPDGTCGLNFTVGSLQMELVLSTSQLDVIRISHTDPPVTLAPIPGRCPSDVRDSITLSRISESPKERKHKA